MAKSKVLNRPMFKGAMSDEPVMDVDAENVGIMSGFKDILMDDSEDMDEDEMEMSQIMGRTPDSPEILMNNLRGDMRSIDARRDELADLVGYQAATETPEPVLAMLQPVLAQQGGIGALPQPGAMPPGPPPGMMPPPPPGGMPPPGMMPPDMGMPPPPEMAGGIAGLPAGGPPPVQMARGGIVQRFSNGSDEDGVTPAEEDSSSGFAALPADLVQTSRQEIYDYLARQPSAVPALKPLAERRAEEYRNILGSDRKSAQAQLLLELGQRAFGYAANVDEQGRPLKGSQIARLSGAIRTLPGAVAKYAGEVEKEDRALKLAGIQAAEKERESVRDANAKLVENQRKTFVEILKKAGGATSMFGKGAWEWGVVNTPGLLAKYAAGETDEDQTNLVESAISKLSQPRVESRIDPDTQLPYQVSVPPVIPAFVTQARDARKGLSAPAPATTKGKATPAAATPTAAATTATPAATAPAAAATTATPITPVAAPAQGTGLLPPSMRGPQPTVEAPGTPGALTGRTLWGESARITGPGAVVAGTVSRIPGLGAPFPEVTQAQSLARQEVENLIEAFLKSGRAPVAEQERLRSLYSVGPQFFDDPAAYRDRLIAIDEEINKEINLAKTQAFDDKLSSDVRKRAREFLSSAEKFRSTLGVPVRIYTEEDAARLAPGTQYLWQGRIPAIRGGKK